MSANLREAAILRFEVTHRQILRLQDLERIAIPSLTVELERAKKEALELRRMLGFEAP